MFHESLVVLVPARVPELFPTNLPRNISLSIVREKRVTFKKRAATKTVGSHTLLIPTQSPRLPRPSAR